MKLNVAEYIQHLENKDEEAIIAFREKIDITKHLSIQDKMEMERAFVDNNILERDGYKYYSEALSEVVSNILIVEYYTNINGRDKDIDGISMEDYDLIMKYEGVDNIFSYIFSLVEDYDILVGLELYDQLNREIEHANNISVVLANSVDAITKAINIKDINKLINSLPKNLKKMQDNGTLDRLEEMLKNIGLGRFIEDLKRGKAIEKIKSQVKK